MKRIWMKKEEALNWWRHSGMGMGLGTPLGINATLGVKFSNGIRVANKSFLSGLKNQPKPSIIQRFKQFIKGVLMSKSQIEKELMELQKSFEVLKYEFNRMKFDWGVLKNTTQQDDYRVRSAGDSLCEWELDDYKGYTLKSTITMENNAYEIWLKDKKSCTAKKEKSDNKTQKPKKIRRKSR